MHFDYCFLNFDVFWLSCFFSYQSWAKLYWLTGILVHHILMFCCFMILIIISRSYVSRHHVPAAITRGLAHEVSRLWYLQCINTLRPRQNGRHFADDIFKCIFLNENVWISIKISLKFAPKGPINIIPALVQIMAWRRLGDKPLSEPMIVCLTTHICVTRPQWVNSNYRLALRVQFHLESSHNPLFLVQLTNLGLKKMADILQTTYSNAFSWKLIVFLVQFH